ncbi:MAG: AMP-binding protein [Phototrophicaceae bacterium]|jgi:acyl-CoA synthetase (AMP-forming)/AMP-acid ligase II
MFTRATRHSVHSLLDAPALQGGDETAILYVQTEQPPQAITRTDFAEHTARYAAGLTALGIQARDLVVIAHTQNLESIYLFWAALRIGAVPSMFPTLTEKLDPAIYRRNLRQLITLSNVRAVLTTDTFADDIRADMPCAVYGSSAIADYSRGMTVQGMIYHAPTSDDVAFLQHSSGTTGLQKGVALSHRAVLNQLASYSDAIALNDRDVIVSWLPLYHDMGLIAGFMLPLMQGIPLVLMSPFDWVSHPAMLFKAIDVHGGTLCWLPNFAYNHCARRIRARDLEGIDLSQMRLFINCSEPVYAESHTLFLERFAPLGVRADQLSVSYAMAENTFAVTQTPLGSPVTLDVIDRRALEQHQAVPIAGDDPAAVVKVGCGQPIAGVQVQAVDGEGNPLPERAVGELAVRSDSMLTEYHQRPDLNPFTPDGWYRTGDMGYIAGGEVFVIGRQKDIIINAGKNVYPQDIEAIVNSVNGVRPGRAVVFGVPDEREGTELIAVVAEVLSNDPDALAQVKAAIRLQVAHQSDVTVNYVTLVDDAWLIKTSSGKVARAANREKWLASQHP